MIPSVVQSMAFSLLLAAAVVNGDWPSFCNQAPFPVFEQNISSRNGVLTPTDWFLSPCTLASAPNVSGCSATPSYLQVISTPQPGSPNPVCEINLNEMPNPNMRWWVWAGSKPWSQVWTIGFQNKAGDSATIYARCNASVPSGTFLPEGPVRYSQTGNYPTYYSYWEMKVQVYCGEPPAPTPAPPPKHRFCAQDFALFNQTLTGFSGGHRGNTVMMQWGFSPCNKAISVPGCAPNSGFIQAASAGHTKTGCSNNFVRKSSFWTKYPTHRGGSMWVGAVASVAGSVMTVWAYCNSSIPEGTVVPLYGVNVSNQHSAPWGQNYEMSIMINCLED